MKWRAAASVILGGLLWLVSPLTAQAHDSAEDHRDSRGRECSEAENWWQDDEGHWHCGSVECEDQPSDDCWDERWERQDHRDSDENWRDRHESDDRDQSHHHASDDRDRRDRHQDDDRDQRSSHRDDDRKDHRDRCDGDPDCRDRNRDHDRGHHGDD